MANLNKYNTDNLDMDDEDSFESEDFSSDEDDDRFAALRNVKEGDYNLKQRKMQRYGTKIDTDKKQSMAGYYIKIVGMLIIILIVIPAEIVLRNSIFESELPAIKSYQQIIGDTSNKDLFEAFCKIFILLGRYIFVECAASFLYLFADPVLGFKSAFTLYIGAFVISIIKLFYKVPRPYWIDPKVEGMECHMDFSGPSSSQFFMTFFYSYNIVIFLIYYSSINRRFLAGILLSLNAFVVVIAAL